MTKQFLEITDGFYNDHREPVYRNIAKVFIPPEFIIKLIRGEIEADSAVFPEDAALVDVEWDNKAKIFVMTVESREYPETSLGALPYNLSLRLRKTL